MASIPMHIENLPSEILIQVLSPLSTLQLLPIARISRRFRDLTLRMIHTRLTEAARLSDHELILECYHPSVKISTPYLHCDYLGTDGLERYSEDEGKQLALGQMHALYSRFRPVVQEENRRGRARHPAASGSAKAVEDDRTASVSVHLDDGEMFSQLCAVTNLVKLGPRRGLFLSHVNVNDGVVRVFRRWLAANAAGVGEDAEDPILWTDRHQNVGIRFRVQEESTDARRPTLWTDDDDPPVSYNLVYEELLVRTSTLLLEVEKSDDQEVSSTDIGFVFEPGSKIPCMGQLLCVPPPRILQRQQQWASQPSISVGGA
ncbi:unnamed protein product [Discula destructiva]